MRGRPVLSSTPLQILYNLNCYYLGLFAVSEILLFIYKAEILIYPGSNLVLDIVLLFFLIVLEIMRIFVGSKGNLTEKVFPSIVSVGLTLGDAVLVFYFIFWQTYVLRFDVVLCSIYFTFQGLEFFFSFTAIASFVREKNLV